MYGKSKDTSRHYATNRGLMEELIKWRDSATDPKERRPSEEFGKMIMDIAERLTNHSCFRNYPYHIKEEMRSYAHEKFMTGV